MRIDSKFEHTARLANGQRVHIRLLRPGDEALILDGFRQLSEDSRYERFHGAVTALSPEWLRYLAAVDQQDHIAVGAYSDIDPPHGLGVARCIRLEDDPRSAEVAVTVVDRLQGQGLGTLLMGLLVVAARERGIDHFRACVRGGNVAALALVKGLTPRVTSRCSAGEVDLDVDLSGVTEAELPLAAAHPTRALLRLAAQGVPFRPPKDPEPLKPSAHPEAP